MAVADQVLDVDEFSNLSLENIEELKAAVEDGNLTAAAAKAKEALEMVDKITLNIAVTGESGSGKSSFVNAIRGLGATDEGSAETGVVETTSEPTAYPHPKYPNVKIWDLPGIGTPTFQPETYLEQVQFSQYDFFIIIASERFKYNHVTLALEIQRLRKKFYFVYCKVDQDLRNERDKYSTEGILKQIQKKISTTQPLKYSETAILALIRENCVKNLETAGFPSPQVFLIANPEFGKYDSPKLQDTLIEDLPRQKRLTFLRTLPNISKEALEKKKKGLQSQLWLKSIASAAIAAVPIPGLAMACDVAILVASLKGYCQDFGLDEDSLAKLAGQTGKPVTELKAVIKSPLLHEITKDLVIKLLTKSATGAVKYPLLFLSSFPVIGTVIASVASAVISFPTTFFMLRDFLNDVADDAIRVLEKAVEQEDSKSEEEVGDSLAQGSECGTSLNMQKSHEIAACSVADEDH